jgi:hypothetical protein
MTSLWGRVGIDDIVVLLNQSPLKLLDYRVGLGGVGNHSSPAALQGRATFLNAYTCWLMQVGPGRFHLRASALANLQDSHFFGPNFFINYNSC